MKLARKDLLGIQELSVEEINLILDTADPSSTSPRGRSRRSPRCAA